MNYNDVIMLFMFQPQAKEKAEKEGFEIGIAKTSFNANTKALAENEGEGLAKVIFSFSSFISLEYHLSSYDIISGYHIMFFPR